ncbi:hypothetical protein SLA2020_203060 [Shorea laevis]
MRKRNATTQLSKFLRWCSCSSTCHQRKGSWWAQDDVWDMKQNSHLINKQSDVGINVCIILTCIHSHRGGRTRRHDSGNSAGGLLAFDDGVGPLTD